MSFRHENIIGLLLLSLSFRYHKSAMLSWYDGLFLSRVEIVTSGTEMEISACTLSCFSIPWMSFFQITSNQIKSNQISHRYAEHDCCQDADEIGNVLCLYFSNGTTPDYGMPLWHFEA